MVGLCESMILPLMSCYMVKLWKNCKTNCGTRPTHKILVRISEWYADVGWNIQQKWNKCIYVSPWFYHSRIVIR